MTAAAAPLPNKGSVAAWVMACRPPTLTAAFVPVAVGVACTIGVSSFDFRRALLCWLGASLLQIASNFANDVFDYEKGADTEDRLGPTRAVQAGLLTARQMRTGLLLVLLLAVGVGGILAWLCGWVIVAIGVSSIVAAVAYTGGPYPLGYHGLGDVFVLLFFGFVAVCGTCFATSGEVPTIAWPAALAVGSLATRILVVNNVRDFPTDRLANKRTVVVRFGLRAGLYEYVSLIVIAYGVPLALALAQLAAPWVLLPLLSAPLAARLVRELFTQDGSALNGTLVATAKLLFVYGSLFAVGLGLSAAA